MSETRMINEKDAPLYIDVICYGCKRRMALSNTHELDGRRYCFRCQGIDGDITEIKNLERKKVGVNGRIYR